MTVRPPSATAEAISQSNVRERRRRESLLAPPFKAGFAIPHPLVFTLFGFNELRKFSCKIYESVGFRSQNTVGVRDSVGCRGVDLASRIRATRGKFAVA